jgi:hypothetical protein
MAVRALPLPIQVVFQFTPPARPIPANPHLGILMTLAVIRFLQLMLLSIKETVVIISRKFQQVT